MNWGMKTAAFLNPETRTQCCSHLRLALFHSTPVLERKRRKSWNPGFSYNSRRFQRLNAKQSLLRNLNAYADYLFQSWQKDFDNGNPSSSGGPSWFKQQYSKGSKKQRNRNYGTRQRWGGKGFQFCKEDVEEGETIFRSAFGGNRFFFWSFVNEEDSRWSNSSGYSNYYGSNWRYQSKWDYDSGTYRRNWRSRYKDEYDSSSDSDSLESDLSSDRLALGLSAYGPLKLEDVKTAYRACALKWHPDRHQGSSKAVAEEKFKLCSAAYQSLCDNLDVA